MAKERDKNPRIQVVLPARLHKDFKHKLLEEELTAQAVLKRMVELWTQGDITLPQEPVEPTQDKKLGRTE